MSKETPWDVVFVFGLPGSGKRTQCTKLSENFGFVHLNAGDLLREETSWEDSELGKLIEEHMKNGTIVPTEIICKLIKNAIQTKGHPPCFLIDGFPRNKENLDGWMQEMRDKVKLHFVLNFQCPEDVCISRCLGRGQGRVDDNEESLKKSCKNYLTDTLPVITYFEKLNLVKTVDATKSIDKVYSEVDNIFKIWLK